MSTAPQGWQDPKTVWTPDEPITVSTLNRIEGNIKAVETGDRTLDQTQVPSSNTGTLRQILDWIINRIKAIAGVTNWYDKPPATLQEAKNHIDAPAPHKGHETPAGAQAKVDAHEAKKNNPHDVTAAQLGLINLLSANPYSPGLVLECEDYNKIIMHTEAIEDNPVQIYLPSYAKYVQFHWSGVLSANYGATAYVRLTINGSVAVEKSYTGDNPGGWAEPFDEVTERIPITKGGVYTIGVVGTDSDNASASATVHGIKTIGLNINILDQ